MSYDYPEDFEDKPETLKRFAVAVSVYVYAEDADEATEIVIDALTINGYDIEGVEEFGD